ncbi:MAG TPA: 4Fe-4S binding protein [Candidatus Cloacimonadota bacterium]|nr:4Fe-4S binding protein [Candidatus Cloacimonadota bacterium]
MKRKWIFLLLVMVIFVAAMAISKSTIFVETNFCVGCGDCTKVCPVEAISIQDGKAVIDAEKCIACEICVESCTYKAIRKNK